ncbi:MAG: DNA alkylation repair protein [Verrucomicrobiota bacterium]
MSGHPIERFSAPNSIQAGVPLKKVIDARLVDLISDSLEQVFSHFSTSRFKISAKNGLEELELKERAAHIADALQRELPDDFEESSKILIQSFGPELEATQDYGLQPFFYMPHAALIGRYSSNHFDAGMRANYELTKRFTAEFSIRGYIIEHRDKSLELLRQWTRDPNPHVRRLVSEGSRPRLPWAIRLKEIDTNPDLTLPLLEILKDDPELYVRRSVANHLGDIGKANLPTLLQTSERWLVETRSMTDPVHIKNRRWVIRHALRHPAKKQHKEALRIRLNAK